MHKKIILGIIVFLSVVMYSFSEENDELNWNQKRFNNKIFLGYYSSYCDDNIHLVQSGYEAVFRLANIKPEFNLLDMGIGLNGIVAYDMVNGDAKDNLGRMRPKNSRLTFGFELNWNARLYVIPIQKINSRIYLEGCGMGLVVYSRKFPDTRTIADNGSRGSHVNIGVNVGLGMDYPISNFRGFTTIRYYHTSNGKEYEVNPGLNAIGILMGLQF